MLANILGWAAEENAKLVQGVDVGDLGIWGPRGVFFSDHAIVRALVSPVCFLGLPLCFLAAVRRGRESCGKLTVEEVDWR